jgi:hypothetical protein
MEADAFDGTYEEWLEETNLHRPSDDQLSSAPDYEGKLDWRTMKAWKEEQEPVAKDSWEPVNPVEKSAVHVICDIINAAQGENPDREAYPLHDAGSDSEYGILSTNGTCSADQLQDKIFELTDSPEFGERDWCIAEIISTLPEEWDVQWDSCDQPTIYI